jgi:hypothetical protein
MLTINQRLDMLAASRIDFVERGMIPGAAGRIPRRLPGPSTQPPGDAVNDEEGGADDDGGATDRRDIIGEVVLAQTPSKFFALSVHGAILLSAFSSRISSSRC